MLSLFADWRAWVLILVLATFTLLTSVAKYRIGQGGYQALKQNFPQVSDERWERAANYFQRYGSPVVFLSFLPVLAWIIPPAAGAFGIEFRPFLVWAFIAKLVRYWILAHLIVGGYQLIS